MGYAFTPESVIRDAALSRDARFLWTLLASYPNKRGMCWPSQAELAKHAAASDRSIRRWLDELTAAGLLETQLRGHDSTAIYALRSTPLRAADRTPVSAQTGHQCPTELSQGTTEPANPEPSLDDKIASFRAKLRAQEARRAASKKNPKPKRRQRKPKTHTPVSLAETAGR